MTLNNSYKAATNYETEDLHDEAPGNMAERSMVAIITSRKPPLSEEGLTGWSETIIRALRIAEEEYNLDNPF